jgi:mgtE-like transporter
VSRERGGAPDGGTPRRPFLSALGGFFTSDRSARREGLVGLVANSTTSFIAGATLAAITNTFVRYPGLLVLVPAAIGLRGNVFSALGNRISTSIHTGTFRVSARPRSALGQNVIASLTLTATMSIALAVFAKGLSVAFGVENTISIPALTLVALVGGTLGSLLVLAATLGLTAGAVRFGWDLDNVVAPVVATLGDVLTIPALWLGAQLLGHGAVSMVAAAIATFVSIALGVWGVVTRLELTRTIVRQSLPVLMSAALLSAFAGLALERRLAFFAANKVLLILEPAFVSSVGALGGILSSRLSTRLHLGTVAPRGMPGRAAWNEASLIFLLTLPIALYNGAGAQIFGALLGETGPALAQTLAVSLLATIPAVVFVAAMGYYSSVASFRVGLDPDTYGIAIVTSSVDFVGAMILIVTATALGIH